MECFEHAGEDGREVARHTTTDRCPIARSEKRTKNLGHIAYGLAAPRGGFTLKPELSWSVTRR